MALSISEVNALDDAQFEAIFGNVIELCSDAAVQISKKKPFKNLADLCKAFDQYLDGLSKAEKLVVLRLHPDLAGRLASQGELTRESTAEQRSAGLLDLTEEQKSIINTSNEAYKTKFGFPFIICARENKVQSIIEGLQRRYNSTQEQEITVGINEVKKICKLRILDIVKD
ncbi:2-oxo-4-hydroxy-4-carboxy-5-ureidoimidazoline decarboxylase-like isoform X1 [Galleria mellonella]|uniref:2-oxo-4-hydroxy-4-carboxy-5-ureidoimidazoline decarboxylase n=1 Tax=Galleria mellonella TaxID=7137 RepID=A0A6J1X5A3_GALME|nr:2-oxo-4-hydroxy-4-carboxy-5-ureidoimidazoline decarboxylase-like isoform X1 [Galleria mellonella]